MNQTPTQDPNLHSRRPPVRRMQKDSSTTDSAFEDSMGLLPQDHVVLEIPQGSIFIGNEDLGAFPGWVGLPNLDDDNQDGSDDWSDLYNDQENDLAIGWLTTNNATSF